MVRYRPAPASESRYKSMPDTFHAVGDAPYLERRQHPRRRIPFSWIQLAEDNGGMVLDVSERGLSVQAVRSLTEGELPHIRFKIGKDQPWIESRGRIAWVNALNNIAGLEFIELADEARDQIRRWFPVEESADESVERIAFVEKEEPIEASPALLDPENPIPFPEIETTERDLGNPDQQTIPEPAVEDEPPVESVPQYPGRSNAATSAAGTARSGTNMLLSWSELEARIDREIKARDRTGFSPRTNRFVGVGVIALLLLSALFFVGYHWHENKLNNADTPSTAFVTPPEPSPSASTRSTNQALAAPSADASTGSTKQELALPAPSNGPEYALQVVATTDKTAAEALAAKLKRSYFPAFVYFRGTDPFYRVLVGPYSDRDSKLRMEELKAEGYTSFRASWNPSSAPPPRSPASP